MSHPDTVPQTGSAPDDEGLIDLDLPGVEALLAGAMALMTAYALGTDSNHRALVARKAEVNLACLAQHPQLSANFHRMAAHLQQQWCHHATAERQPGADAPRAAGYLGNHAVVRQISQTLGVDNAQALVHLAPSRLH